MRKPFLLLFLFLSMAVLFGCQKEISNDGGSNPNVDVTVLSAVSGLVVDENGAPLSGVQVSAGTRSATTDASGQFTITNASQAQNAALVKAEKAGYFPGFRNYIATENQQENVKIQLIKKTNQGSVSGGAGGTVTFPDGVSVTLPANGFVYKSNNQPYTGQVNVAGQFIDPSTETGVYSMPGDLLGTNTAGASQLLKSFGMVAIELTDASGAALQLAPGKQATVGFPIPAAMRANAPASIPLWSFDETKGIWIQEGSATRSGNTYSGQVAHFSFWNCDLGEPFVKFKVKVVNASGQPLPNVLVRLTILPDSSRRSFGRTNGDGIAKGRIFQNTNYRMDIYGVCGIAYSQLFSSVTSDVDLGVVTLTQTSTSFAIITGTAVGCNNVPIANGTVKVTYQGRIYDTAFTNGTFLIRIPYCTLGGAAIVSVRDNATSVLSPGVSLTLSANVNAGQLIACQPVNPNPNQFIRVIRNGVTTLFSGNDTTRALYSPIGVINAFYPQAGINTYNNVWINGIKTGSSNISMQIEGLDTATGVNSTHKLRIINLTGIGGSPAGGASGYAANPLGTAIITEFGPAGNGFVAGSIVAPLMTNGQPDTLRAEFRVSRWQ